MADIIEKPIIIEKIDYTKITDEEVQVEIISEYKAKKIAEQKEDVKKTFYEAKDAEYATVRATHAVEIAALNDKWQVAEDNDYTIPQ